MSMNGLLITVVWIIYVIMILYAIDIVDNFNDWFEVCTLKLTRFNHFQVILEVMCIEEETELFTDYIIRCITL